MYVDAFDNFGNHNDTKFNVLTFSLLYYSLLITPKENGNLQD